MAESRLVTLTGPGGVGKTRLALELADRSRKAFRDGAEEIELASLEDESNVASAALSALSVPDQSNRPALERLVEYLRDRQILVVLDNCEHLLPAVAALVAQLLREAPGLRILATSREPLGIAGECICLIPPLTTPSPFESHPAVGLEQFEAVTLLIDRARSIVPDFAVTDENSDAVVQLCNRLDGMPLAIELAATRLRALSVTQIVKRLDRRFQLLTGGDRTAPPRQQTLRTLIDWSCELCTPAEQLLWARLSVFPGSFDLESAENVCGFGDLDPLQIIDLIDRLVAKSIIFTERSGELIRYGQLMTIREYGAELLTREDGYEVLKRRQRNHYLQRARDMVARWCGPGQAAALSAMRNDHANLLSALEWSVNTPGELRPAAELASLLRYHWIVGGFLGDGRRWLDRILKQPDEPNPERGAALWVGAWVALLQGDREAAAGYLNECHAAASALNDPALEAHASHWWALHQFFCGNLSEAIDLYESAIATHKKAGDIACALTAIFQLAVAQTYSGDLNKALSTCRESLELSSRYGERWTHAYSLWISAICRWHLGEMAQAKQAAIEALEMQQNFKDDIGTALTVELLSWIAASDSRFDTAAELANTATSVWRGLGTTVDAFGPHLRADSVRSAETVRSNLGSRRIAEMSAQQPHMTKDDAIAKALGVIAPASKAAGVASPLTMREREIAGLVAEGLSNRSIAQSLMISPRTVDGHVEHTLSKLGFVSRAQIASWAAQQAVPPHP